MSDDKMKVSVFRFDPSVEKEPHYNTYEVPFEQGMSAMDALDYIYQNLDGTLAYYDHAGCSLGICGRCTGKINGKAGLFCQTLVQGDTTLEPLSQARVLKDLVLERREDSGAEASESDQGLGAGIQDMGDVPVLLRREIEALIAAPLIKAFIEEFGRERTLEVARRVIASLAREGGKLLAVVAGGNTMAHLSKGMPLFSQGGALELDVLEAGDARLAFNVTRCRYAEMYKQHGLEEFGYLLSCGRDFALMDGFNPRIKLTRTRTIMEGADHCDFRFSVEGE